jgi:hypothetical protein
MIDGNIPMKAIGKKARKRVRENAKSHEKISINMLKNTITCQATNQ